MPIIKDRFGHYGEAFDLIMKKEFAYQILRGVKKLEFRKVTTNYCAKFFKRYKPSDRKHPDYFVPKDVGCLHFHDYGNTWFLDIGIEYVDLIGLHPEYREYLHKYGHHEYDAIIDDVEKRGLSSDDNEVQWMIAIPLLAPIDTNLDCSKLPKNSVILHQIPDDCWITDPTVIAQCK